MTELELVYARLHLSARSEHESWVRVDAISEVHPRIGNSTPYSLIGSRVFLDTGRELEVVETPNEVLEIIAAVVSRALGEFDSEKDSLG